MVLAGGTPRLREMRARRPVATSNPQANLTQFLHACPSEPIIGQGSSLIQYAQSGEDLLHSRRIPAKSGCDILRPHRTEQPDRRIPQRGHRLRTETLADLARVLAERHIANVM